MLSKNAKTGVLETEEDRKKQVDQQNAEQKEKDIKHNVQSMVLINRELKLAVVDVLESLGLPSTLRGMIVTDDLAMIEDPKERKEAFAERLNGLYELYTKEVRKGVAVERMEYLRGHTPPASKGSPFSLYDRYKREGNVKGMVTAKIEEFFSDMD